MEKLQFASIFSPHRGETPKRRRKNFSKKKSARRKMSRKFSFQKRKPAERNERLTKWEE
jgi:hypothetical protein